MTIGIQISQTEINNRAGAVARAVFAAMREVAQFKDWLDTVSVNDLQTVYSFTADDANLLKSVFTDLANMNAVWTGSAATGTMPRDHRTFAKRAIGTGNF